MGILLLEDPSLNLMIFANYILRLYPQWIAHTTFPRTFGTAVNHTVFTSTST